MKNNNAIAEMLILDFLAEARQQNMVEAVLNRKKYCLSIKQYQILAELYRWEEEWCKSKDIRTQALLTESYFSRLINSLEAQGFLERSEARDEPGDRRRGYIRISEKGISIVQKSEDIIVKILMSEKRS